jgi:hypothetical protein
MKNKIQVLTSEVKKGDIFKAGNQTYRAQSDSYISEDTGVWSVDIYGGYRYGWRSIDVKIEVTRIRKASA